MNINRSNSYPVWRFRQFTTPAAGNVVRFTFLIPRAHNYMLQKVLVQYSTTGPAPTTYQDPEFILTDNTHNRDLNNQPIPFRVLSSPGRFDNTALPLPTRNQQYLNAKSINWLYLSTTQPEFLLSGFQGVGGPAVIDIMMQGRAILKQGYLR